MIIHANHRFHVDPCISLHCIAHSDNCTLQHCNHNQLLDPQIYLAPNTSGSSKSIWTSTVSPNGPCEYLDAAPHASDEAQRRSLDAHFGSLRVRKDLESNKSNSPRLTESVERTIWFRKSRWCPQCDMFFSLQRPFAPWSLKQFYRSRATPCLHSLLRSEALFHRCFTCWRFPFAIGICRISWKIWEFGVISTLFSGPKPLWV